MKRNIKFAGIVAATLLAVAPVATQSTQAVSAATATTTATTDSDYTDVAMTKGSIVSVKSKEAVVYNYSDSKKEMISANKSFENGSNWQTDYKRTMKDGSVYYRVSTNEWMKAGDLTVSDPATNPENPYTKTSGVVKLIGSGVLFQVTNTWNTESPSYKVVKTIKGDSSWRADGKATDSDGRTFYRIGANQWVLPGDHGTFTEDK